MSVDPFHRNLRAIRDKLAPGKHYDMVRYCDSVVQEIRAATNEVQLKQVIDNFLARADTLYASRKSIYVMNMIVSLQAANVEERVPVAQENMRQAIAIFKAYRNSNREFLF